MKKSRFTEEQMVLYARAGLHPYVLMSILFDNIGFSVHNILHYEN